MVEDLLEAEEGGKGGWDDERAGFWGFFGGMISFSFLLI
jgi:hypothetical protein